VAGLVCRDTIFLLQYHDSVIGTPTGEFPPDRQSYDPGPDDRDDLLTHPPISSHHVAAASAPLPAAGIISARDTTGHSEVPRLFRRRGLPSPAQPSAAS
jgi:hypothetical protein